MPMYMPGFGDLSMSLMVLILISIVVYRVFDKGKESESIW